MITRSQPFIGAALLLSLAVVWGAAVAPIDGQAQSELAKAIQAGKKLYEDGEHKEAALKFAQALTLAKEKSEIGEICRALALAYYALGEKDDCQFYLKRLFEADPGQDIEAKNYPVGFVGLYYIAKNEAARTAPPPPAQAPAKTVARGDLVLLSEVDVQPKSVKTVDPIYPPFARPLMPGEERRVALATLITEDGNVGEVRVMNSSEENKYFEDAARKAVLRWKFAPAQKDGVAVRVWKEINFTFRPNRSENAGDGFLPPFVI